MNTPRGRHVDFYEGVSYDPTMKEMFFTGRSVLNTDLPKSDFLSDLDPAALLVRRPGNFWAYFCERAAVCTGDSSAAVLSRLH